MIEYAWIGEDGSVIEVIPYEAPLHVDNIKKLSNGLPRLRPVSGSSEPDPEKWQDVIGPAYAVGPDGVERTWIYTSRPLKEVQDETILEIERFFNERSSQGFNYQANWYSLTRHGMKREDLVRYSPTDPVPVLFGPPVDMAILTTSGERIPIPKADQPFWLQTGDFHLLKLYATGDQHVANVRDTTTPQQAAEYDYTTGWPPGNPDVPGWPIPGMI